MRKLGVCVLSLISMFTRAWNVREAEPNDIDAIVDVVIASMPDDPSWGYRYPNRAGYPQDHRQYNCLLFKYLCSPKHDDWKVLVAEHPDDDKPTETIVAAFAVWNASYINLRKHGRSYTPQNPVQSINGSGKNARRDVDWAHLEAFRNTTETTQAKYFDSTYEVDQLHLQVLGTLPRYRRRGLATALCKWGMDLARKDKVVITLISSPMGLKLYSHLGFRDLGIEAIQLIGEDQKLLVHPMDFIPHPSKAFRLELI